MSTLRPIVRHAAGLLLPVLLLGGAGCVMLKLRELRAQLADFDRYFTVVSEPRLTVVCHKPLLNPSDAAGLLRLEPSSIEAAEGGMLHTYHFHKRRPAGERAEEDFDMVITLLYSGNQLAAVGLPRRFEPFVNPGALRHMFRKVGQAEVSAERKRAAWSAPTPDRIISKRDDILRFLGEPLAIEPRGDRETLTYHYVLTAARLAGPDAPDASVRLEVDRASERLLISELQLGRLNFQIDFTARPK
jgi:hypothetical protein